MVFDFATAPVPLGVGASVLVGSLVIRRIRMGANISVAPAGYPAHHPVQQSSGHAPAHVTAIA